MKSYKKIFVYMTDREKKEKILSLCGELNLGLDEISYAQINTPLVELVGLPRLPEEMRGKAAAPALYNMPVPETLPGNRHCPSEPESSYDAVQSAVDTL